MVALLRQVEPKTRGTKRMLPDSADQFRHERTLGSLLVSIAAALVRELGIGRGITADALTAAIEVEPSHLSGFSADFAHKMLGSPLCHDTAKRLFPLMAADEPDLEYEFKSGDSPEERIRASRLLARAVGRATMNGEGRVFEVRYANHSFIVVARNGLAEILQSFMAQYTIGERLLKRDVPLDAFTIAHLLHQAIGDHNAAKEAQEALFFSALKSEEDATFKYRGARLLDDDSLRQRVEGRMRDALTFYRSILPEGTSDP